MRCVSKANCTNFKVKAITSDLSCKELPNYDISLKSGFVCLQVYKSVLEHVFFFFLSWKVDAAQVV